jgi:hypothetical protein
VRRINEGEENMFNKKTLFVPMAVIFIGLLSVPAAKAQATPPDPAIRTGGGHGSVAITSPDFVIVSPTGDSPGTSDCLVIQHGVSTTAPGCFFVNKIMTDEEEAGGEAGATIRGVIFVVSKASFSGALSCALDTTLGGVSPWFSKCTVAPNRIPVVIFSGGSGIPFGGDFSFGFRQFNTNATFRVVAAGVF